jgi:hypothetical protein
MRGLSLAAVAGHCVTVVKMRVLSHAGVSRNPILSGGSMATEKLTEYTPGQSFAYEVTGFTNIVLMPSSSVAVLLA